MTFCLLTSRLVTTADDGIPVEAVRSPSFWKFAALEFRGSSAGNVQHARAQYLSEVVRSMRAKQPDLSTILYIMDGSWRPDNRVENCYRLWRQLKREGFRLPVKANSPEYVLRRNHELKFCGAVALEDEDIAEADRALRNRDGCLMLSARFDATHLQGLIDSNAGDTASSRMALPICMEYVANRGSFCVYPSGAFDDAEVFVYLLGLGEAIVGSGLRTDIIGTPH